MRLVRDLPRVDPGQRIRARAWNDVVDAVNGALLGPRDADDPLAARLFDDGAGPQDSNWVEVSRSSEIVRVEQEGNPENFVDLARPVTISWRASDGSLVVQIYQ